MRQSGLEKGNKSDLAEGTGSPEFQFAGLCASRGRWSMSCKDIKDWKRLDPNFIRVCL